MPGTNLDSYGVVVWVTSQFSGALNSWWLNRKQQAAISDTFDPLITQIRTTSLLPNIRDDAITTLIQLTEGSLIYAN
jgi:cytochrome P450